MNTTTIILFSLAVLGLNILIFYFVIHSATGTKQKLKFMKMQVKLISKIAQRNGVSDLEIKNITEMYVEPLIKDAKTTNVSAEQTSVNDPKVMEAMINKISK